MSLIPSLVDHAGPLDRYSELLRVGHDRRTARRYAQRKWARWKSGIVGMTAAVCPWCGAAVPGGRTGQMAHMHREIEVEELLRWARIVREDEEEALTRASAQPILEPNPEAEEPASLEPG